MRTLRLFSLLDHLRGRRAPVSAEQLARALDVSPRTIYRDMATLQAMGAPIRGEAGIGYQMEKGYFLPPLHFDPDELDALMLGMRLVAARGEPALGEAAQRALTKIGAVLSEEKREAYRELPLKAVSRPSEVQAQAARHLAFLRAAIRERAVLRIHYRDLKGRESWRDGRPLGLTVFDDVWLLTIWCERRSDFRNLRVDRVIEVSRTGRSFRPERGKRFEDYIRTL